MQLTNAQRAEVLCNALPYIQAYKDKIASSNTAATPW